MITPNDFKCKRCGSCCMNSPFLTEEDIKRIKNAGYDESYFVENLQGKKFMKLKDNKCIFLDATYALTSCKIYISRPQTCREYPSEIRENGDCRPETIKFDIRN